MFRLRHDNSAEMIVHIRCPHRMQPMTWKLEHHAHQFLSHIQVYWQGPEQLILDRRQKRHNYEDLPEEIRQKVRQGGLRRVGGIQTVNPPEGPHPNCHCMYDVSYMRISRVRAVTDGSKYATAHTMPTPV